MDEEVTAVVVGVRGGVPKDMTEWLRELGIERDKDVAKVTADIMREVLWGNTRVVKAKRIADRAAERAAAAGAGMVGALGDAQMGTGTAATTAATGVVGGAAGGTGAVVTQGTATAGRARRRGVERTRSGIG